MMRLVPLLAIAAIGALPTGCRSTGPLPVPATPMDETRSAIVRAVGPEWVLAAWHSQSAPVIFSRENAPRMRFGADGFVRGRSFINRFFGRLEIRQDGTLGWPTGLGVTQIGGSEELMELDERFLEDLGNTRRILVERDRVRLVSVDGRVRMEFRHTSP